MREPLSSPTSDSKRPAILQPLKHRDFRIMWMGLVVSHVGDSMQLHAQNWLVTEMTSSATRLGGVALAQAIPRLLLGLFAGVLVDRFDRRRVLLVTQTLAMVQSLVLLALVATHTLTYHWVVSLAFVLGALDTLNMNARMAMMPGLVPRELIPSAVALQALGVNVVQVAGPSLTGVFIATTGAVGCIAVNAATFIVLLVALLALRISPTVRPPPAQSGGQLREGLRFVAARPILWTAIVLAYLHGLLGVSALRLLALYARIKVGTGGQGFGLLAAATGVGAFVASLSVTARARGSQLGRNMVIASWLFSASLGLMALAQNYLTAFAALTVFGFGQMAFRSAVTTTVQMQTPDALRGRVVSLLTLDFSLWSIGALFVGTVVDTLAFVRGGVHMKDLETHATTYAPHVRTLLSDSLSLTLAGMCVLCLISAACLTPSVLRAHAPPREQP